MATIVNLPPTESTGAALGQGLSEALSTYAQQKINALQMKRLQDSEQFILSSPNRETAMSRAMSLPFQNIQQLQMTKQWIDERFPQSGLTPTEVHAYDPNTGAAVTKFVPRQDLPSLNTTEGMSQVFGTPGLTFDKPDVQEMYAPGPNGTIQPVGKYVVGKQPSGSMSLPALTASRQQAALENQNKRLALMEQRMAKTGTSRQVSNQKAFNAVTADLLNLKKTIGSDGSIIVDFQGNEPKAQAYRTAIKNASKYISQYPGDINRAAYAALEDAGAFKPPPTPAAAPVQPEQPGFFTRLYNRIEGPSQSPKPSAKPTKDSFEKGKIYTDSKGNRAEYLGDGKWKEL